jgi:hypothetical protein
MGPKKERKNTDKGKEGTRREGTEQGKTEKAKSLSSRRLKVLLSILLSIFKRKKEKKPNSASSPPHTHTHRKPATILQPRNPPKQQNQKRQPHQVPRTVSALYNPPSPK